MVTVGLLGCGAQELPGGAQEAGRDLGRPVIDATERNLDDAGCPPEGKIACLPLGCSQVFPIPQCIHGVWSCPMVAVGEPISCPLDAGTAIAKDSGRCNPASGALACAHDAGADAPSD
jgi:hypothetical protein